MARPTDAQLRRMVKQVRLSLASVEDGARVKMTPDDYSRMYADAMKRDGASPADLGNRATYSKWLHKQIFDK